MHDTLHPRCPIRTTLELVGGKWRLLIIQQLRGQPRRFGDLAQAIPEISEKMLTQELRHLALHELIEKVDQTYRLTAKGNLTLPLIESMAVFGQQYQALQKEERGS